MRLTSQGILPLAPKPNVNIVSRMAAAIEPYKDKVARLCKLCSNVQFQEDRLRNQKPNDYYMEGYMIKEALFEPDYHLKDTLPQLPKLKISSRGCDFCGFLLKIILSHDTNILLQQRFGTDLKSLSNNEVIISFEYHSSPGGILYRNEPQTPHLSYLAVHVAVMTERNISFTLICLAEAAPGESTLVTSITL